MSGDTYRESDVGLPPLFPLRGYKGTFAEYVDELYGLYRAMMDDPAIRLWGRSLHGWGEPTPDGRDELFWHLVTGEAHGTRRLDLVRCARMPWTHWTLRMLSEGSIRVVWWRERGAVFATPVDFCHAVRLRVGREVVFFGTAHPVSRKYGRTLMRRAGQSWLTGQSGKWKERDSVAA